MATSTRKPTGNRVNPTERDGACCAGYDLSCTFRHTQFNVFLDCGYLSDLFLFVGGVPFETECLLSQATEGLGRSGIGPSLFPVHVSAGMLGEAVYGEAGLFCWLFQWVSEGGGYWPLAGLHFLEDGRGQLQQSIFLGPPAFHVQICGPCWFPYSNKNLCISCLTPQ